MKRWLFVWVLFISQLLMACGSVTHISNQTQFDAALERINNGEEMHLVLRKGQYVLKTAMTATAPLSIKSCGAEITTAAKYSAKEMRRATADHYVYRIHNLPSLYASFYGENDDLLRVSESVNEATGVNYLEGEILATNGYEAGAAIKIPIPSNLNHLANKSFPRAYGYLDSGWKVVPFELVRSDAKYFYCTTLDECPTKNYQYDAQFYKKKTRFVIFNAELKPDAIYYDKEWLYIPKRTGVVYGLNARDKEHPVATITANADFTLKNVTFRGFSGITVNSKKEAVCDIRDCKFENSLGCALKIVKENGEGVLVATVKGCSFKDCSAYNENIVILRSTFDSRTCIEMSECTLTRHSKDDVMYKNASGAIWVDGDVMLDGNAVYNPCRCHLYFNRGKIVAKGNVLFNTDEFNAKVDRNLSSDWGLVYCNHIFYGGNNTERALNNTQHQILLEDNLLYGAYSYGGDARGIYIDNGRGDVECRNNIVLNVQGYSIDTYNSKTTEASAVRNRYSGNIVTSRYRLASGEAVVGDNVPVTKSNIVFSTKANNTSNVQVAEEDQILEEVDVATSFDDGRVRVSNELYRMIKKSPAWKGIRRYVGRK